MLPNVARAKTITGLLLQALRLRWAALGGKGKTLLFAGLVLAGAVGLQLGVCAFGACPASGPCSRGDSPCAADAAADPDAPCPYSARQAEEAAAVEAAEPTEHPPCHAE